MSKLTPWLTEPDGWGAFRAIAGTDPMVIANRVAFIEKTPRVRIRRFIKGDQWEDWLNWASGDKGNGPDDKESRKWCDEMLKLLGYELEDQYDQSQI